MAVAQLDAVRKVFDRVRDQADGGDGDLLLRYRRERDQDAFGSLVRRHGPMVLGVCRRVLRNEHAAEDAFQATFVVLAKRADAVKPPDRLAPWLYGVAYRTALKARGRAFRRAEVERDYATEVANRAPSEADSLPDVLPIIDEQLNALPEKYRAPLVLCGLQGLNKQEAAARLGVPEGTVSSRLARAREMLRDRLARRGVIVPAAGFVALLSPNALCAAVPPALTESVTLCAATGAAIPATVLTLSNEVLTAMSWLKVKMLYGSLLAFALATGGMLALTADDKKPVQPPAGGKVDKGKNEPNGGNNQKGKNEKNGENNQKGKNEKNGDNNQNGKNEKNGDNNQNGKNEPNGNNNQKGKNEPNGNNNQKGKNEKDGDSNPSDIRSEFIPIADEKPGKPDGEKPVRVLKLSGKVGGVDAKENTLTLAVRGDGGIVEKLYPLAANAKITVDGKDAKLADVPKNATATGLASATKEGQLPQITELRVTGDVVTGVVKAADASSVTLAGGEGADKVFKTNAETQVTLNGKPAKTTDLKVGDKATVILTSNGATALSVLVGAKRGDAEKPGEKPVRPEARAFAGKIASVDAATRTLLLASKGEGGRELPVKLTADAKITIDGKAAKLDDLKKGMLASFTIAAAKDGQPREATAVTVTGPTFNGVVKQIDASTITVGNEKVDRVFKLAPGGKVMFGEKEGKFADVTAGDRVTVTLASDDSGAVLIVVGAKREGGDKPKGDKEEGDE